MVAASRRARLVFGMVASFVQSEAVALKP